MKKGKENYYNDLAEQTLNKIMSIIALAFSEMGLNPISIGIVIVFSFFFLISFAITSPNMDTKGLLRVLYSKPVRNADGSVEYPESRRN